MRSHKRFVCLLIAAACIAALTGFTPVFTQGEDVQRVYAMMVNGQEVGHVPTAARGLLLFDQALEELHQSYQEEVFIEGGVFFRKKTSGRLDPEAVLKAAIRQSLDVKVDAYAILINGEVICHVRSKIEADKVLEAIQKPFIERIAREDNHELYNIALQEDITFRVERIMHAQLVDVDQAVHIITVGEETPRVYEVQKGDSLWSIARAHGVRMEDIEAANPDMESTTLKIGQKLNIMTIKSLVTVVTKVKFTYTEAVPFKSETKDDNTLFVGDSKVVQQGRNGEKEIEVYIHKENGREVRREKIGEQILKEPVAQITARGTKPRPAPARTAPSRGSTPARTSFTRPSDLSPSSRSGVELTPWSTVNSLFPRGSIAKVTHVDTKLVFYAYRHGGTLHADVEPLTAADTEVMRKIFGSWSWERESVIVEIGGKRIAGSMNGMPHGQFTINNNNFRGHFCIHFLNSRLHGNNRVCALHQAALRRVPS